MDKNTQGVSYAPKILKVTPLILADGIPSYNVAISYPEVLTKKIKKIAYTKDVNFTEAVLFCIDEHQNKLETTVDKIIIPRGIKTPAKSVRFRESQVEYIEDICAAKGLKKFTQGVLNILCEYFNIKELESEER